MSDQLLTHITAIVSIISLTILEGLSIYKGEDGAYLALIVGLIAGLGGYRLSGILSDIKGQTNNNNEPQ